MCEWIQTDANTAGQQYIGNAWSLDECEEMVRVSRFLGCQAKGFASTDVYSKFVSHGKQECPDATMANMDGNTCWCQYGDYMFVDDDPCCVTVTSIDLVYV